MRIIKIQQVGSKDFHIGIEYTKPFVGGFYTLFPFGDLVTRKDNEKGFRTSQVVEVVNDYSFISTSEKNTFITYKIEEYAKEV